MWKAMNGTAMYCELQQYKNENGKLIITITADDNYKDFVITTKENYENFLNLILIIFS